MLIKTNINAKKSATKEFLHTTQKTRITYKRNLPLDLEQAYCSEAALAGLRVLPLACGAPKTLRRFNAGKAPRRPSKR